METKDLTRLTLVELHDAFAKLEAFEKVANDSHFAAKDKLDKLQAKRADAEAAREMAQDALESAEKEYQQGIWANAHPNSVDEEAKLDRVEEKWKGAEAVWDDAQWDWSAGGWDYLDAELKMASANYLKATYERKFAGLSLLSKLYTEATTIGDERVPMDCRETNKWKELKSVADNEHVKFIRVVTELEVLCYKRDVERLNDTDFSVTNADHSRAVEACLEAHYQLKNAQNELRKCDGIDRDAVIASLRNELWAKSSSSAN